MTTKALIFKSVITRLQIAPPENLATLLEWVSCDETITFFSWKMFKLKKIADRLTASPDFDTQEADRYIKSERLFLKNLRRLGIKFNYLKIIPDELPGIFFSTSFPKEANEFATYVRRYFKKIYPRTKVIKIGDFLSNPSLEFLYKKVLSESQKAKISKRKFNQEEKFRTTYYTDKQLPKKESQKLARKAFGLFAAETATIFAAIKNPVLLAGARSIDTYKYEFYKYPKDRPILPKIFVL